ncbi:unnamed protein product [Ilex paraguariensis]|uniref:Uncharacterized protein n=1 Tax=Ilex paraguariensis TaxID=185542 RepID=A0ABC8UR50_9AQUA
MGIPAPTGTGICQPASATKFSSMPHKLRFPFDKFLVGSLCKTLLISGLFLYLISLFLSNNPDCPASEFFSPLRLTWPLPKSEITDSTTNLNHLMFGLVGSVDAWKHRKAYIESWWRPNATRGYLYLDTAPTEDLLPWPPSSPPFRVSDDNTELLEKTKHVAPIMVRMVHAILEVLREEHEGMRWLVMGDDDSIFFVDNMVDVLAKYDHTKYIYIGGHSETIMSNVYFGFNTGFGGAGFALSHPLAVALAKNVEDCFMRYPYLRSADQITMTCIADIGVTLTANKGIHQIDLHNDISGFLSAHPQSPLLSLHHFGKVFPIFPSKNRFESVNHLMKAAKHDQSRLLQQTHSQEPLETFRPWGRNLRRPFYLFDTRRLSKDPCEAPHSFFFESIEKAKGGIVTMYVRASPRGLPVCSSSGNHSADYISKVQVFSSPTKLIEVSSL